MAAHAHVLAEIHQHIWNATRDGLVHHAVHGVFLADAAEVNAHPRARQKNATRPALDFVPADEFAGGADAVVGGNDVWLCLPVPQLEERQRRGIKRAAREKEKFLAEGEQPFGVRINRHPTFARRRVDASDQTIGDEPRIGGFKLRHPRHDLALKVPRHGGGHAVELHLAVRAHRAKRELVHPAFQRALHGLRDARGDARSLKTTAIHGSTKAKALRRLNQFSGRRVGCQGVHGN